MTNLASLPIYLRSKSLKKSEKSVSLGVAVDVSSPPSSRALSKARSSLSSSVVSVSILPLAGWTNETFEAEVCSKVGPESTHFGVSWVPASKSDRLLIPDCFFNLGSGITSISVNNVIFAGNSTYLGPIDRLAASIKSSSLTSLSLTYSTLQISGVQSLWVQYAPNWSSIWNYFPLLNYIVLQNGNLYGPLPTSLPAVLRTLSLDYNYLSGTIPPTIFGNYASIATGVSTFLWSFYGNQLQGTIPPALLTSLPSRTGFTLILANNQLTGTIPSGFLNLTQSSTTSSITLTLGNNSIAETFPPNVWGLPLSMPLLFSLSIDIQSLDISGSIPSNWMTQYSFPALQSFSINLKDCGLSISSLHTGIFPSAPSLVNMNVYLSNNPFNSPIPSNLLPFLISNNYSTSSIASVLLDISYCGMTGALTLPIPPTSMTRFPKLLIYSQVNSLTLFTASVNSSKYAYWINVADNTAMQGLLGNLFSSSSRLAFLDASRTALTGAMPYMASVDTSALLSITMDGVAIDFCSGGSARAKWTASALRVCSLLNTNAFDCQSLYPSTCVFSEPIPVAPAIAAPTPVGCPGTRPSNEFECVNGVWTSTGTVTAPTIVITPGTSEVIVNGNVTSGTVVLQGTGSTITVTGCFTNLSVVTIQLTPEDLKKLGSHSVIELLRSDGNCSDFSTVAVGTTVSGSSCRTVKVDKATTSNGSLNGVFSVSSSGCNLWWIILVSVLAALTVVGIIVLLVVLHIRKKNAHSSAKAALHG